jgi:hypothetical protein
MFCSMKNWSQSPGVKWVLPLVCGLLLFLAAVCPASSLAATPYEILKECDEARGNLSGITWIVSVEALERGHKNSRRILVKSSGFNVVAETLKPPRRKGQLLILVKGNMWFYKPDLSKPVPVSQRQKLLGLAANGDIASTNYAEDYTILSFEEVDFESRACYLFLLEAKTKNATYSRIKYWVSRRPHLGIKAEFYTARGDKLLKSARMEYDNRIAAGDGKRVFISRMVIHDELMSEDTTTLNFSDPVLQPIPDHVFNLNLLRK